MTQTITEKERKRREQGGHWKRYCQICGKRHIVKLDHCPACGGFLVLRPLSKLVAAKCKITGCSVCNSTGQ